jgi:hypothetical protein
MGEKNLKTNCLYFNPIFLFFVGAYWYAHIGMHMVWPILSEQPCSEMLRDRVLHILDCLGFWNICIAY